MLLKPKIAIATNIAWNLYNFRRSLAREIVKAGYDVVMIAAEDSYAEKLREEGWTFIATNNLERTGINPVKDTKLFFEFVKIYKEQNVVCALHYHSKNLIYASLAASYLKIPYIPTIAGLAGPFSGNRFLISKLVTSLYRFSLKKSYCVVFQNKDDKAFFERKKIIKNQRNILVPGSGVDMNAFDAEKYAKPPADKLVFLMPARLSKTKGLEYYIEAAKAIKKKYVNVIFQLAGPFDDDRYAVTSETVKKWVNEGIIEYLGVSDFIQNEIGKAHVIVYPSYYSEGLPKALIESAAMSKPIITTDNVGCREAVKNDVNGFLIPVKNLNALVNACEQFINMSVERREEMGKASRQLAIENFDDNIILAAYLRLISTAIPIKNVS